MTAPFPAALPGDAAYVSPTHLRTPFRSFLVSFDKGIYWLRMPQDTGKTQFIRGIVAKRPPKEDAAPEGIDSAISSSLRAIAVELAPGAGAQALAGAVKAAFEAEFGPAGAAGAEALSGLGDPEEAPAAFATWLARLGDVARATDGKRLLVCIDGLDAGAGGTAPSVLDVLPGIGQMPGGVLLLLTSRPKEAWPDGLFAQAEAKFASGPAVAVQDVGVEDAPYVDTLRRLFQERLRPVLRARAIAILHALLETRATFEKGGRDPRLTGDAVLRDALKDDWKKLTNKFPRYSGQLLPVASLVPLLDQFDRLWVDVMDRGERKFRYVHLIIQRIADGTLPVEDVAGLPRGADLAARLGVPA
ncbi:hypothetical protein V5F59_02270 [Xanthobacter autotrophicus DSM 431]|uniref:hypothetical protein n=1 Tax=Xanthobacter nonsaccharivorans TaxID=3119912 RepID=UPI003726D105